MSLRLESIAAACLIVSALALRPVCPAARSDASAAELLHALKCEGGDDGGDALGSHRKGVAHFCAAITANRSAIKLHQFAAAAKLLQAASLTPEHNWERLALLASLLEESAELAPSTDMSSRLVRLRTRAAAAATAANYRCDDCWLLQLRGEGLAACHLAAAKAYVEIEGGSSQVTAV